MSISTIRHLADIAGVSIRQIERYLVIERQGIPELMTAALSEADSGDYIALGPAEKIARLPQDQQLDALNDFYQRKSNPEKRESRPVVRSLLKVADILNSSCRKWSQEDRQMAHIVLCDYGRQLAGLVEDDCEVSE